MDTCNVVIHYGPAHPSAHGVLRYLIALRNEYVTSAILTIGLLHRGTEKIVEIRYICTW